MTSLARQIGHTLAASTLLLSALVSDAAAQSLRGSRSSIDRMYRHAHAEKFSFLENSASVRKFVEAGLLVKLEGNDHFFLHKVGFPYVRPQVRTFVERLSAQYVDACGELLVVTSAVRPATRQPANSTDRSVHPTGIAIDLRKPRAQPCLRWLRSTLLALEKARVLEATEERTPAHFHVAVFPKPYATYVATLNEPEAATRVATRLVGTYTVRAGDTLWQIARAHDTTVDAIADANDLSGQTIRPGQELLIPAGQ